MIKQLFPNTPLQKVILVALGLLFIGALSLPTVVKAGTTSASSAADCINVVHQHHFVPNPIDPTGLGTCEDGRTPTSGTGSLTGSGSSSGTPSAGTASKPVLGLIPVPAGFPTNPSDIIASAVTVLLGVAGLIFFIVLLLGGLRYLTAGGDEKANMAARQTLTNAFIGLIIVVASFLIAQILFAVFGLDALVNVI